MKNIISTNKAPSAIGPYSQAVEVNGFIFVSGQLGLDSVSGNIIDGGVGAQTKRAMENIIAILEEVGLELMDVVKTTIFLTDMNDFAKVNEVYKNYFAEDFPARSTVQVAGLPKGGVVEIEVIASR